MSDTQEHSVTTKYGGSEEESYVQNICSCGWEGKRHYAYEDLQLTASFKEGNEHERMGKR